MDVTQALKDTENALRDFIAAVLEKKHGSKWIEQLGVSADRIERWRERKSVEEKRQDTGVVEERLLYYADFYDLRTILKKNWQGEFAEAFDDWKTMEVWLIELEKLRDSDAHRRELLPHQKHLALGIAGEIRTRLIRYRSKQETSEDYFPRIEAVRDSLGTIWTYGNYVRFNTGKRLRVGDQVEIVVAASDPFGADLEYQLTTNNGVEIGWQSSNVFTLVLDTSNIGKNVSLIVLIRSSREYHARGSYDDSVALLYDVLPQRV